MKTLKIVLMGLTLLAVAGGIFVYRAAKLQGRERVDWSRFDLAKVAFDTDGIPTIEADNWAHLVQAQGFVTASDRLWQMDLMRRSASGRIAEWFGNNPKVLEWDEKRRREDWEQVASKAAQQMPEGQRADCDLYAAGVNQFIESYRKAWGVEYALLGETPDAWECKDTLLVFLSMVEDLSESTDDEAPSSVWRKNLSNAWERFLFPQVHPWNIPTFGPPGSAPAPVSESEWVARKAIGPDEVTGSQLVDDFFPGSNAWVYRGPKGVYVANDPHLGYNVPLLWYPLRLKKSAKEWVVGASLPGIPGVVLGRNASIAWGFTNAKEDVDDLLEEEISPDGKRYVARFLPDGRKDWQPIENRPYTIRVRGDVERKGFAQFTHRGPLSKRPYLGDKLYSRQWLGFAEGRLKLPVLELNRVTDWASFNAAIDQFTAPAQSIVFADSKGGIGIRVSGTGIRRSRTGLVPQRAVDGEWEGFQPSSDRPRIYVPHGEGARFLSTANQRLWTQGFGEHWSSEMRQERIVSALSNAPAATHAEMEALQRDTKSRYFKELVTWVSKNAKPANDVQKNILEKWKAWDGVAEKDPAVFTQAVFTRGMLSALVLGRARQFLLPKEVGTTPYVWKMQNAWEVRVITDERALKSFGLDAQETASWLLTQVEKKAANPPSYAEANRWRAQHPFARAVPVIGRFFAIDEAPQMGYEGLVRVERPMSGATTRLVWDLQGDEGGSWAFPVGQSGHFLSPYYTNFRRDWFAGKSLPVFKDQKSNFER